MIKTSLIPRLVFGTVLWCGFVSAQSTAPKGGTVENGKKLFTADGCYQCHGRQGQGGAAGPRIAPTKIPLEALRMYIRHPSGAMPPYTAKVLSDAEVADIYSFLKTIPAPAAVKDIPLLNP
jgi:mono/diheme cytochrome c family protein